MARSVASQVPAASSGAQTTTNGPHRVPAVPAAALAPNLDENRAKVADSTRLLELRPTARDPMRIPARAASTPAPEPAPTADLLANSVNAICEAGSSRQLASLIRFSRWAA